MFELEHPMKQTNIEPNRGFTRFTEFLIEQTQTLNELERVHLLVIELEHPTFGIKLRT